MDYSKKHPSFRSLSLFLKRVWSQNLDSLNKIVVLQLAVLTEVGEAEKYVEASMIEGHWLASDFA